MRTTKRKFKTRDQRGFSLIEIMIVITLLGLVGTFAVTNYMAKQQEGYRKMTKVTMNDLRRALDDYFRLCNSYPTMGQGGLEALVSGPSDGSCKDYTAANAILKKVPKDAWGMDFQYVSEDGRKYSIVSFGADRKAGGEGNDKDITTDDPDF